MDLDFNGMGRGSEQINRHIHWEMMKTIDLETHYGDLWSCMAGGGGGQGGMFMPKPENVVIGGVQGDNTAGEFQGVKELQKGNKGGDTSGLGSCREMG